MKGKEMKSKIGLFGLSLLLASAFVGRVCAMDDGCTSPLTETQLSDHWVAAEGVAPDKDAAIDEAIKRAVSMVYGEVMSAEKKLFKHSAEASNGETTTRVHESKLDTSVDVKTAGFVREYRVISVSQVENNRQKAHIHARIINPRAGIDSVILVTKPEATAEMKAELIKVGPKKSISGREIANIVEGALCGALAESWAFRVRTENDVKAAIKSNIESAVLVDANMIPSSELLLAGKMLTTDYILSTRLEKIAYVKKLGQDKVTKKFGQIQSMKVTLSFKLTDIRTGTAVANDTLNLLLGNDEIKAMLIEDEEADLLRATLGGLVEPLSEWIKGHTTK